MTFEDFIEKLETCKELTWGFDEKGCIRGVIRIYSDMLGAHTEYECCPVTGVAWCINPTEPPMGIDEAGYGANILEEELAEAIVEGADRTLWSIPIVEDHEDESLPTLRTARQALLKACKLEEPPAPAILPEVQ